MEKTAMNRLPIKAYSRGESDNPNFPFLDYVIFPETQRILENPSADANANVAYLYFEAMKNAPIFGKKEPGLYPKFGKHCENCKHYKAYYCEYDDGCFIPENEGRCYRKNCRGHRMKPGDTCDSFQWKD